MNGSATTPSGSMALMLADGANYAAAAAIWAVTASDFVANSSMKIAAKIALGTNALSKKTAVWNAAPIAAGMVAAARDRITVATTIVFLAA